jgi:hypothetical protein
LANEVEAMEERPDPTSTALIDECAVVSQLGDDLSSPEQGGKNYRGHPAPIVGVNIRVMVEEERHNRRIPFEGSAPERSLSAMIPAVDVGSIGKEHTAALNFYSSNAVFSSDCFYPNATSMFTN